MIELRYADLFLIDNAWDSFLILNKGANGIVFIDENGDQVYSINKSIESELLFPIDKYCIVVKSGDLVVLESKNGLIKQAASVDITNIGIKDYFPVKASMTEIGLMILISGISGDNKIYAYHYDGVKIYEYAQYGKISGIGYTGIYYPEKVVHFNDEVLTLSYVKKNVPYSINNVNRDVKCINNRGIDQIRGIRSTLYSTEKGGIVTIIWGSVEPEGICDSLVLLPDGIADLTNGKVILDLTPFAYDLDKESRKEYSTDFSFDEVHPVTNGITRKKDGSGYIMWLHPRLIKYDTKLKIMNYLETLGIRNKLVNTYISFPEYLVTWKYFKRAGRPFTDLFHETKTKLLDSYLSIAGNDFDIEQYQSEHKNGLAFLIYRQLSLYPYYHYKATGEFIVVVTIENRKHNVKLIGYSKAGHRRNTPSVYASLDFYSINTTRGCTVLYVDLNNKELTSVMSDWIILLGNIKYIDASREDKINMINLWTSTDFNGKHDLDNSWRAQ